MLERIKALITEKDICVLSTVFEDARPYCSLMAYVSNEQGTEIYMATRRTTQKYANLKKNPAASLLIDTRDTTPRQKTQALTVSGTFEPIESREKKDIVQAQLLKRHPQLKDLIENPNTVLLCIKAQSFLLLDGPTDSHFVNLADR